jgi:hypothetical protein
MFRCVTLDILLRSSIAQRDVQIHDSKTYRNNETVYLLLHIYEYTHTVVDQECYQICESIKHHSLFSYIYIYIYIYIYSHGFKHCTVAKPRNSNAHRSLLQYEPYIYICMERDYSKDLGVVGKILE